MLRLGNTNIRSVFLGDQKIIRGYVGNDLVFGDLPPPPPLEPEYLEIYCDSLGSRYGTYLCIDCKDTYDINRYVNIEFDRGDGNWKRFTDFGTGWTDIYFEKVGLIARFRAGPNGNKSLGEYGITFTLYESNNDTIKIRAKGSVNTLLDRNDNLDDLSGRGRAFSGLFYGFKQLYDVSELKLKSTTLSFNCYQNMFSSTTIKKSPKLPAMNLESACYQYMFAFSSIEEPPELPAVNLEYSCYLGMFQRCKSMKRAPVLPATTLSDFCYAYMFKGDKLIDTIEVKFTKWGDPSIMATDGWLDETAKTGTFKCPIELLEKHGPSTIPEDWQVIRV